MPARPKPVITVVDYNLGNLNSVKRHLERAGAEVQISGRPEDVAAAQKLVLPGVGHFAAAMRNISETGLTDALEQAARVRRVPTLGICLGLQLMAKRSEEGEVDGLGWVEARVVRFRVTNPLKWKIPHIGWTSVKWIKASALAEGVPPDAEFYFSHAYHLVDVPLASLSCDAEYEHTFTAGIEDGNLFGLQMHPEKSHDAGATVLRNFVAL
jgi:glutamine amidotransferase